jgi:dTDP-4-amino-4,6-dideoxygalactose transaminase
MQKREEKIVMFYPCVSQKQRDAVDAVLCTRWIGQGPKVDEFEQRFEEKFNAPYAVSLNSCTSAIETACDLLDLKKDDAVITTPLTCTLSNIPLLRRGCKLIWADIRKDTLTLNENDVARKALRHGNVKAIMNVHLGGIRSNISAGSIPIIDDAAQALGVYRPEAKYTCYSFQAIKQMTTCDGGMIVLQNNDDYRKAKLLRWAGIDRDKKKANDWQAFREREMLFDIELLGHKRQMTDVAAAMGIAGLEDFEETQLHRKKIFDIYRSIKMDGLTMVDGEENVYWLATMLIEDRENFVKKLHDYNIETNIVQARNDIYQIFGGQRQDLPNMNWVEDRYISIPLNNKMTLDDAYYIKEVIESGW